MGMEYLGVAEVADLLQVTVARAAELVRADGFPPPAVELASGPVWDLDAVEAWARHRDDEG